MSNSCRTSVWNEWVLLMGEKYVVATIVPTRGRASRGKCVLMLCAGFFSRQRTVFRHRWGCLHGLVLAIERAVGHTSWGSKLRIPQWISIPYCLTVVFGLWSAFLMPDINTVFLFCSRLSEKLVGNPMSYLSDVKMFAVCFYSSFIILYHVWGWWRENKQRNQYVRRGSLSYGGAFVYGFKLFMILTNAGARVGFVYFQF